MFMTYIAVYGGGAYAFPYHNMYLMLFNWIPLFRYVTEDQVATGYPLLTFIGLILMPWICGFPVYSSFSRSCCIVGFFSYILDLVL